MSSKSNQKQRRAHSFTRRVCQWRYCAGCGLVALNNEATRRRMREACE